MIKQINLSLTSLCTANCVFCPKDRGEFCKEKTMSFRTAKRIIDELTSEDFARGNDVERISFGENGDALMNKDFLKILRYAKEKLPDSEKILYTNFYLLSEDTKITLISEGLVDKVYCNIDSLNHETYGNIKGLDLNIVWYNFVSFVKERNRAKSNINVVIIIMDMPVYELIIKQLLESKPLNYVDERNYNNNKQYVTNMIFPLLNPLMDDVKIFNAILWAERESALNHSRNKEVECPNLKKINTELFFNAEGGCYVCCFDSANKHVFGNVNKDSIIEIINNEERKKFVQKLEDRKFEEIGSPCNTVMCCHNYSLEQKKE